VGDAGDKVIVRKDVDVALWTGAVCGAGGCIDCAGAGKKAAGGLVRAREDGKVAGGVPVFGGALVFEAEWTGAEAGHKDGHAGGVAFQGRVFGSGAQSDGLHGYMRGEASNLETRCSTELRRPKVSFRSSRMSRCITSSCVAMCSTAEVSRTTASCWLWARLDRPIVLIAAQDSDAPHTAAKTSIMGPSGYLYLGFRPQGVPAGAVQIGEGLEDAVVFGAAGGEGVAVAGDVGDGVAVEVAGEVDGVDPVLEGVAAVAGDALQDGFGEGAVVDCDEGGATEHGFDAGTGKGFGEHAGHQAGAGVAEEIAALFAVDRAAVLDVGVVPGGWIALAVEDDGPRTVICDGADGVHAFDAADASQECEVGAWLVVGLPVAEVEVVGDDPLVVDAVAVFAALVVVHPGVGLEDAEAVWHQRGVADAGFDVLVVRELHHQLLVRVAERVANDVVGFQPFTQCGD